MKYIFIIKCVSCLIYRGYAITQLKISLQLVGSLLVWVYRGSKKIMRIWPDVFAQALAQDADLTEAGIMAAVQKPFNQSILGEPSGPPAWKQLPTWYRVSEDDRVIPPDAERMFAQRMNATTLSINSSHVAPVSHPDEIAQFILNATKGSTGWWNNLA